MRNDRCTASAFVLSCWLSQDHKSLLWIHLVEGKSRSHPGKVSGPRCDVGKVSTSVTPNFYSVKAKLASLVRVGLERAFYSLSFTSIHFNSSHFAKAVCARVCVGSISCCSATEQHLCSSNPLSLSLSLSLSLHLSVHLSSGHRLHCLCLQTSSLPSC